MRSVAILRKKIQDYFGHMLLQRRLMSFFFIICIIPLAIIGTVSVYTSINATRDSAIEFSDATLIQIKSRIETIMDVAETVSLQLADDAIVQTTLKKSLDEDLSAKYATDLSMDTYLNYELAYVEEVYGFYIIGENKGEYKSAYNSFYLKDLTQTLWYKALMKSSDSVWFSSHQDSFAVQTSGQKFISHGMRIIDNSSNKYLGVVLVDIELEKIEQILLDSFGDLGQVLIVDENNRIVASSNNLFESASETVTDAVFQTHLDNSRLIKGKNNAIVLQHPLKNSGWRILGIIPSSNILKDSVITVTLLIGMIILMSILSYFFAKIITGTITKPIDDIIDQMQEVESGNFDVCTEVIYEDEIGNLSNSFNKMTYRVNDLMGTIVEEQHKLRKYELKALQAQINPHFLYNTLDSVVWLARMQRYEDIVKIVTAMTKLFRTSLSRGKDIITIEDEIANVTSYLMIQKTRYKTHFDYDIDIPESIYHYKTLKLVLQPLVENSIYHGVKVKKGGGSIHISAEETTDTLIFKVTDTGLGMSEETLEDIHTAFETNTEGNVTMYGIKNVNDRLRIFFGKEYGLKYESTYGEGTTAIITIPKYTGDEKYA